MIRKKEKKHKIVEQDFYRTLRVNNPKLESCFSKLASLYNSIPDTEGCLENNTEKDGCNSWCCFLQCPQMLYVEFLFAMKQILKEWDTNKIAVLVERSIRNYVKGFTTKGCIFFNEDTNLCDCHKKRSYNCRIYSITPYEEFHPRYLKAKEAYKNAKMAIVRDQCNLCKTINGEKITTEDTNRWWNKLVEIERSAGIKKQLINDGPGGSYRTPHDHILMYFLSEELLEKLQTIRLYATDDEKRIAVDAFINVFYNRLENNSTDKQYGR
jgi:Fe-S-cluster containining protein